MGGKREAVIRAQGENACQPDFPEYFMSNYLDITGSIISVSGQGRYTINHPRSKETKEIVSIDAKPDVTVAMWVVDGIIVGFSVKLGHVHGAKWPRVRSKLAG